jgi:arginine:ornithine antiporter/lysine permease
MILVPYWLSAGYAAKLAITGESYTAGERVRIREGVVAILAALYGLWLLYAAGPHYLLLSALLYVLGLPFWVKTRREQGKTLFAAGDALLALLQLAGAVLSLWGLWSGKISL